MFRIGFVQRLTTTAVRSMASVPRSASPLISGLRMQSPIAAALSKIQPLNTQWLTQPQHMPMVDPTVKPEPAFPSVEDETDNTMYMDSVLRKRRLKMKKHKLRKRRRLQRSLKKRLGKI